jgi:ABC-type Zn2+ transport system substrate-binding protein/surface adhesin
MVSDGFLASFFSSLVTPSVVSDNSDEHDDFDKDLVLDDDDDDEDDEKLEQEHDENEEEETELVDEADNEYESDEHDESVESVESTINKKFFLNFFASKAGINRMTTSLLVSEALFKMVRAVE